MDKPLTVYKASAGSGKTFTLAIEYIKLLISNPNNYRQTLAVTFTNKATEEMKTRILSQLYGIWKGLPSSADYTRAVCSQLDVSPQLASKRAGLALGYLMHNYSYFRVETIDSFFQSVLRNLARELDLTANLRVGLNDEQVEQEAVDTLIDDLRPTDQLLDWLMRYITDNIADDRSWNVIWQIKRFGLFIFRETYKRHAKELRELSQQGNAFFDDYKRRLRELKAQSLDVMKDIAASFFDSVEANGLDERAFANGRSGVYGYFVKIGQGVLDDRIVGKRVANAMSDAGAWATKTNPRRQLIMQLAESEYMPLLNAAEEARPTAYSNAKSADVTLRHLSQIRLLSSIEDTVRDLNAVAGRFLLSDTQALLHGLINQSDSPFIYEKIGARLEHIMIDEFQDTSSTQWLNFEVLLRETMSHRDTSNLIVGDVKQSIYRWRSGDWRLLNSMGESRLTHVKSLDTNWRSDRRVVEFNNEFFTLAARAESSRLATEGIDGSQLLTAYADVAQKVPANRPDEGEVRVELLPDAGYEAETLSRVSDRIGQLLESGAQPGSICILVRTNKKIPIIAEYLMAEMPEVSLVSDEAFRLDASQAVQVMVLAMRLLIGEDRLSLATLAKLYQGCVLGHDAAEQMLLTTDDYSSLLPEAYTAGREELLALPLYDMAEKIYSIFGLERLSGQSAYVCAFFDQLSAYITDHTADLPAFIDEWDQTLSALTIQSDEAQGIRIISIHKSKGLEFDHVIMPFADWLLEKRLGVQIWCEPKKEPFSRLPLVAVDYSRSSMKGTIYEADYNEEHLQNTVDNLNLLYVAFTRAARSLYVVGRRKLANSRSTLLAEVLPQMTKGSCTDTDDGLCYELGETPAPKADKKAAETANVFQTPYEPHPISVRNYEMRAEFRQSNRSRDFVSGETPRTAYIQTGTILHRVFSTIRTVDDIPAALAQMEQEGVLYSSEVRREEIRSRIEQALGSPQARRWFEPGWRLFNECDIITTDPKTGQLATARPDRVMTDGKRWVVVDFKFGRHRDEYADQVRGYMKLLREMGCDAVEGYLWYVMNNKIEEVEI